MIGLFRLSMIITVKIQLISSPTGRIIRPLLKFNDSMESR